MSDASLNRFLARGTAAQRAAFTPVPPTPASGPSPGYVWYETDTGLLFAYDGSAWDNVGTGRVFVRKTADESLTSNTTLQNDDALLFAIAANEVWSYEFVVFVTGNETGDFKVGLDHPSGSAVRLGIQAIASTTGATANQGLILMQSSATASGGAGFGVSASATATMILLKGVVVNGATPGNVQLVWAQNTSNGTATVVLANSYVTALRHV